ncbi:3'-5' exonuclease [Pseudomonas sp.]|uniref:3'-5' exonuclease n=1 Tax=Pseudomonas sp. TaxID=306 RepID=UPI00258788AF|nr:3'-5' exonuclease [Pseudomonas sp.]
MTHIMLDFETLSLKDNATLLSLGACVFDTEFGVSVNTFYAAIDPRTQPGRDVDAGTALWWMEQSDEARSRITQAVKNTDLLHDADPDDEAAYNAIRDNAALPIMHVAMAFAGWLEQFPNAEVWTNGTVDHHWLQSMFDYCGLKNPVKFWNQRDYRTLKNLFPAVKHTREGVAHDALADAVYQAEHTVKLLKHKAYLDRMAEEMDDGK